MFSFNGFANLKNTLFLNTPSPTQKITIRHNSTKLYPNLQELDIKEKPGQSSQLGKTLLAQRNDRQKKAKQDIIKAGFVQDSQPPIKTAQILKTTGPIAGRIVHVQNGDIALGFRRLKALLNVNNVRFEHQQQRFHKKPGKVLEEKRIRRKKKMFNEGVRRLMNLVKEAKRRGY